MRLQLLPQPHTAWHLADGQRLLEEPISAERFNGFKIALAQCQQPKVALYHIGQADLAALWQSHIEPFHFGERQRVTDQHQSGRRGQVAIEFFYLKTRHDRNG